MADADELFTEAPEEVTRYFDSKGLKPSEDWRDFAMHEHAVDFTVARSAGYDVLADIKAALSEHRRTYGDFGSFAEELEPILRKKGWWGKARDPKTGKVVQLGSLHRLRTIYWANMSTAFAAGEWERTWRTRRGLPFLVYEQSVAEVKRPLHLTWVGTVLPVEDPWWRTHYPPNGWLCKCRVRQISRAEARRLGYDPDQAAPDDGTYRWKNKRTGEVLRVPNGIDPGWQSNPGMTRERNVQQMLAGKLGEMPDAARSAAVQDLAKSRLMRAIQGGEFTYRPGDPATRAAGRISAPIAALPEEVAGQMDTALRVVNFSVADAAKQADRIERLDFGPEHYTLLQRMLEQGSMFKDMKEGRAASGMNFNFMIADTAGKVWTAALQKSFDGKFVFLKSFRRAQPNALQGARWLKLR